MTGTAMRYHFDLVCPRCGKLSETYADKLIPPPHVNCGDCLMEAVEIVEMKVLTAQDVTKVPLRDRRLK